MADRVFFRITVSDQTVSPAGRELCPICGCGENLVMLIDSDDWSTDPVDLVCPSGHSWPAATGERWMFAKMIVDARNADPELDRLFNEVGGSA